MHSLYRDTILYHYRHPNFYGELESYTHSGVAHNPLCGDMISMQIRVENDTLIDIAWKGEGCAISQASMSLFSEYLVGKSLSATALISKEVLNELFEAPISSSREKCVYLPLTVLEKTIKE